MSKKHQKPGFRDLVHELAKKPKAGSDADNPYTFGSWNKKAKTSFRYSYTGNEGKNCQLPLKIRKENVLKFIKEKGERGIWTKRIEPTVLQALLDDGSVYLNRERYDVKGRFYTQAVSSEFPQPDKKELERRRAVQQEIYKQRFAEARSGDKVEEEDTGPKKTIKWTKEKHQKLLMDALMGKADKKIVKQVTRTKTLPKKITK